MDRQQLERRLWLGLRDLGLDQKELAVNVIDNWLDAADLYAVTRQVELHAALAASDTPGNVAMRREDLAEATRKAS